MSYSIPQSVARLTLVTIAMALCTAGPDWMFAFGLAMVTLSSLFFGTRGWADARTRKELLIYAAGGVAYFAKDILVGKPFAWERPPRWVYLVFVALWLWLVISEYRRWRLSKPNNTARSGGA